ncbi:L,D-transpeptidase family protein [Leptospira sp. 'Mane']|uniref:L,D-transpeptidase family protein n=1 Tax=Leptospira sp. 'Mane' TaxID=3387407 RepID=UPI00398BA736
MIRKENLSFYRFPFRQIVTVLLLSLLSAPTVLFAEERSGTFPSDPEQYIFVLQEENGITARMYFYELLDGDWIENLPSFLVAIGNTGMISPDLKTEGDGKTPTGEYPILRVFGYEKNMISGFSYHRITKNDYWVDDVKSKYYNLHINHKPKKEKVHPLFREDGFYRLMTVIEYNTQNPKKGKGSMIFIHPWEDITKPTFGCVGMPYENLKKMVLWLKPDKKPIIFISRNIPI